MNRQAEYDIRLKMKVLKYAQLSGNISHTCRQYGVFRETYYQWKRRFEAVGKKALINFKPCPENPKNRVSTT